jgi:hypothetical protein
MRTFLCITVILVMVRSAMQGHCQRANSQEFCLQIDPILSNAPAAGPIPLRIQLLYQGKGIVKVVSLASNLADLSLQTPMSWEVKPRSKRRSVDGQLPFITLGEGQSTSHIIYLHDFFVNPSPGKVKLSATLKVWPEPDKPQIPLVLSASTKLNIMPEEENDVVARINAISSQLAVEQNPHKRQHLYRSVVGLSHASVLPVLLGGLSDSATREFHPIARTRILELSTASSQWQPVVDYLIAQGNDYDELFFDCWRQKPSVLTDAQKEELKSASSGWTRSKAIEVFVIGVSH